MRDVVADLKRQTPSEILASAYQSEIPSSERFFLVKLNEVWQKTQPLKDKKILVNAHLTLITLAFIQLLIDAGAQVHVTASSELAVHQNALEAILKSGITFYKDAVVPDNVCQHYFDIVYDCGAGMLHKVTPKIGMVELTHTDPNLYSAIQFPVVTVDTSETKKLETSLGTGNALTRVLVHEWEQALMMVLRAAISSSSDRFFDSEENQKKCLEILTKVNTGTYPWLQQKYLVFGYGKVGKGIAAALKNAGVPQANIVVTDISYDVLLDAVREKYNIYHLENGHNEKLKALLQNENGVRCFITATGVHGAVSKYLNPADFHESCTLINMGTPDEFGEAFPQDRVINDKKPANFMLEYPTEVKFLDPIFCMLAKGAEVLLGDNRPENGLSHMPRNMDQEMLGNWLEQYRDQLSGGLQTRLTPVSKQLFDYANKNALEDKEQFAKLLNQFGIRAENQTPLACFSPYLPHFAKR